MKANWLDAILVMLFLVVGTFCFIVAIGAAIVLVKAMGVV